MNEDISLGSKRRWIELAVFLLIVAIGVGSRFWLLDWPNFKPIAALCLFAGFMFSRYFYAIAACFCILMISDWQLGGYQWQLAVTVYSSMAIACGLGWLIKTRIVAECGVGLSKLHLGGFVLASLTMSTVFFVLTNLAVWQFSQWYGPGIEGLVACFVAALPFYRWTLAGDLTFTLVILGCYQAVSVLVQARKMEVKTSESS